MRTFMIIGVAILASAATACVEPASQGGIARLAEFQRLDRAEALASFDALSLEEQVELWSARLDRTLADRTLPPAHAAVVADVRANLREVLSSPTAYSEAERKALAVMTEVEIERYFGPFGEPTRRAAGAGDNARVACDLRWTCMDWCSCTTTWSSWPYPSNDCTAYECRDTCTQTETGCGFVGRQACTGIEVDIGDCSAGYPPPGYVSPQQ